MVTSATSTAERRSFTTTAQFMLHVQDAAGEIKVILITKMPLRARFFRMPAKDLLSNHV